MGKSKEITLTLDIDFDMLNRQKELLLKQLGGNPASSLWGLIHMIDDIQDEAEEHRLWKFPDDTGKGSKKAKAKKKTTTKKEK